MRKKRYHIVGKWVKEFLQIFIIAFILPFFVRTFFFQPFNIPSGSMLPSLYVGDYIAVSKLSYGYSRYSFMINFGENYTINLFPLDFNGRLFEEMPKRGDVAVFKLPSDNQTDYIKRIIGVPGDRLQMKNGRLFINGEIVKRKKLNDFKRKKWGQIQMIEQYEETLPNGVRYKTLNYSDYAPGDNTREYIVPPQHYFFMGDNRDDSRDSRYLGEVGFVPFENLVGRADIIFYSHNENIRFMQFWEWYKHIRWERVFSTVK